ncbi:hypothetical protein JXJ21_03045 [candidate division KSB1 bacterium]|nr:hypothetical protein [candidate division KSB1 bacterium]
MLHEYARQGNALLEERDRFIADKIDNTLKTGETGLLFMGMMHQVEKYLKKNIFVKFLILRLPFKKAVRFPENTL